jgi:drug/metabolite transporter (DMT)-like permease
MNNMGKPTEKVKSLLEAILVVSIWATSWVMIKIALQDIPPFTFAGLRYFLAFLILLPLAFRKRNLSEVRRFNRADWINLVLLGLFYYSINQGAIYAALAYLPAVSVSLVLSFTSIFTACIAGRSLNEKLTWLQWVGLLLNLAGALFYFYPVQFPTDQIIGLIFAFAAMIGNSFGTVFGRKANLSDKASPLTVTIVSMGIGSIALLSWGLATEPWPDFTPRSIIFLAVMVVVNTAFAFYLWNKALKGLGATEASIINNTILIQIAVLAWIFLGERLSALNLIGILLAFTGALIVQLPNRQSGTLPASKAR